jgi:hypothetical protein
MIDMISFESPYGIIGKWFNRIYLKKYLQKFIIQRNAVIKAYAETDKWKMVLN